MPRIPPNQISYSGGTINPRAGRFDAYVRLNGVAHRARLPTIERAKAWITSIVADPARPLSPLDLADAAAALRLLPAGFTLTDAARALAGSTAKSEDRPLADAVDAYLADRERYLRPRTWNQYRSTLKALAAMHGGSLATCSQARIESFFAGRAATTRNLMTRNLSAFFNWCKERGWITEIPTARMKQVRRRGAEIRAWTPDQAEYLMQTVARVKPVMVPYFALILFAGVRPEEVQRLPVEKIGQQYISIPRELSKTNRRARTIPIRPNLRAWLDLYPPEGEHVYWYRRYFRAVVEELTPFEWHEDICRHTYGTMEFELTRDAALVSSHMGNSPDIFFTHYRALARPGDGNLFVNIWPSCRVKDRCKPVAQKGQKEHDFAHERHVIKNRSKLKYT
jgi:integrase